MQGKLNDMPEDLEAGALEWARKLTPSAFERLVVPVIEEWMSQPPDWTFEIDYLPEGGTAQGAALEFFKNMTHEDLEALGITIVEGEYPGSTYCAAELSGDLDVANEAAIKKRLPVRFVRI
jgi:hypothetical protein